VNKKILLMAICLLFEILSPICFKKDLYAKKEIFFSEDVPLKEISRVNNIPFKKLKHELEEMYGITGLTSNTTPSDVNLDKRAFLEIYEEVNAGLSPRIISGMVLWVIIGLIILYLLRKKELNSKTRIIFFAIVIIYFGLILHGQPNPMESLVKFFKATAGKDTWPLKVFFLVFFTSFSIIGAHLFCGIACQIGSLQDLLFQLAGKYKIKLPFIVTNGIRAVLFLFFILFMYEIIAGFELTAMYHHVNIFKIYSLKLSTIGWIAFIIVFISSIFIYRPFCSFICPFGFWSWIISLVSIFRVKVDFDKCTHCEKCLRACPNYSMKNFYNKSKVISDCFSCGACIDICPEKCIDYTLVLKKR